MVEVFRTNITDHSLAAILVAEIRKHFRDYTANFDLEDCDRILRVKCSEGCIQSSLLISLVNRFGYNAEVLPDDEQPTNLVSEETKRFL